MKNTKLISGLLSVAIAFSVVLSGNVEVKAGNHEGKEPCKVVASDATPCTIDSNDAAFLNQFFADNNSDFTKQFIVTDKSELTMDWTNSTISDSKMLVAQCIHAYKFSRNAEDQLVSDLKTWKDGDQAFFGKCNEKGELDVNGNRYFHSVSDSLSYGWNLFDKNYPFDGGKYNESYHLYTGLNQATNKFDLYAVETVFGTDKGMIFTLSLFVPTGSIILDKKVVENTEAVVEKSTQTIKLKSAKITCKASALKKAKQTFTIKATCEGKLAYKVASGAKYVTVSKNGKVTIKKGTPKGTYKITVNASATDKYKAAKKTFTITVK